MDNKNELVDIIKYLLGYILKENDTLKKVNITLTKEKAAREAEENIIKMASNKVLEMFGEDTTDDDENESDLFKIKKKLDA